MKKRLALLLAVLMLLSTVPALASGGHITPRIPTVGQGTTIKYFSGGNIGVGEAINLKKDMIIGQRFTVDGMLSGITTKCPSYGDSIGAVTAKLYQWKENYVKSIQNGPIAQKTFVNFEDNSPISLNVPAGYSGEFLVTFSDSVQMVALWSNPASCIMSKTDLLYIDGKVQPGLAMNLEASYIPVVKETIEAEPVDAYSKISLAKPHSSSNMVFTTGDDPSAALDTSAPYDQYKENTGYVAFNVDFGNESPKGASLRIHNSIYDTAKVQIVADDPIGGPIVCEFYAEISEELKFEQILTSKMHQELTGVHTIYVLYYCQRGEMFLYDLTFHKETPEPSWDEQRLADFEATKDFKLKDTYSDTWSATDLLGRKLIDYQKAGKFNPDKQVGLFYWTWHGSQQQAYDYGINQRIIDRYNGPESEIIRNPKYAGWKTQAVWNESLYGIYSGFDEWVLRKHMEMLSAAGVDGLFFDATNGTNVWTGSYMTLAKTIHQMHTEGTPTPGIAFLLPFGQTDWNEVSLERVYESMYSIGLYSDTWYYWDGKPVIMAIPESLNTAVNPEKAVQHEEMLDFFTFRAPQADYRRGPTRNDHWPWLEIYPQHAFGESTKYGCETVSVGVAQNSNDAGLAAMNGENIYGRSYTYKNRFKQLSPVSKFYGYNFIEQWDRAFELNPEFVFITGWNEWTVTLHDTWQNTTAAYPDQYNDEYSRDLEPTNGELKDTYYLLLANKIRQFKGVRPTPTASKAKTIELGDFAAFEDVGPEYFGFKGGVEAREAYLRHMHTPVSNYTGRNDIVLSKVARDNDNLYFYVQTAEDLTPHTDENWMRLFINTDRKYKTGWEGYDFIINRVSPTEDKAVLEKWTGKTIEEWKFEQVAEVDYTYSGNEMMITVPKSLLKIGEKLDIEFKWNDNMQSQGDIMDFYINGDTAPIGRYAYRYVDEASVNNYATDEPVDPAKTLAHATRRFIAMAIDANYAYFYGQKVPIDPLNDETAPVIVNDKTLLPVRFLAESIGATVDWNEEKQEIKITQNNKRIILTLGSNIMKVEKEKRTLQTPAMEIGGRTYVPLRDIVEALEIGCYWIEPGLILCGSEEGYIDALTYGGVDRLLVEYNLIPELN